VKTLPGGKGSDCSEMVTIHVLKHQVQGRCGGAHWWGQDGQHYACDCELGTSLE
jgi:hypothetical protein